MQLKKAAYSCLFYVWNHTLEFVDFNYHAKKRFKKPKNDAISSESPPLVASATFSGFPLFGNFKRKDALDWTPYIPPLLILRITFGVVGIFKFFPYFKIHPINSIHFMDSFSVENARNTDTSRSSSRWLSFGLGGLLICSVRGSP